MGLSLVVGPAHAGKVALLLDRFVAALDRDPWLIVPNRVDVDRVERELAGRGGALLAGTVGTFDTLFAFLAGGGTYPSPARSAMRSARSSCGTSSPPRRRARWGRRHVSPVSPTPLPACSRRSRRACSIPRISIPGLAELTRAYRAELERLAVRDRGMVRRRAVERLTSELGSWNGAPVFAYGFEDLTGAEWRLIEALAARGEVHVSLPYEPGRAAFASLSRTVADLGALAGGDIVELAAGSETYLPPGLAHLERRLFDDNTTPVPLDSSVRFLEGAGHRATLELVAETVLELVRDGIAPEEIGIVCPSLERSRASIETAFGALGVPVSIETRPRLTSTAFGQALLSLLRFAWSNGTRRELFAFLRTPYAGLGRSDVDFLEGRLRGRAVVRRDRTIEETTKLRTGRPLPMLELLADEDAPLAARTGGRARDGAKRLRPRLSSRQRRREARPPRRRGGGGDPRRARAAAGGRGRDPHRGRGLRRSTAPPCAAMPPASPAAWRCSTSRAPARAGSRRFS